MRQGQDWWTGLFRAHAAAAWRLRWRNSNKNRRGHMWTTIHGRASLSLYPSNAVDITSAACMYQILRLTRRARRRCREKHIHHLKPLQSGEKPASSSERYTDVATRDRVKYRPVKQPVTQPKGQHDRGGHPAISTGRHDHRHHANQDPPRPNSRAI